MMRYYGYDEFLSDMKALKAKLSTMQIDAIVFAIRGGASMAHLLAEGMNIKSVFALNASSYDGQQKLSRPILSNIPTLPESAKKILIVDEIVDSGETMAEITKVMRERYGDREFLSACIFQRPTAIFEADFYIQNTDEWIDFYWERDLK